MIILDVMVMLLQTYEIIIAQLLRSLLVCGYQKRYR